MQIAMILMCIVCVILATWVFWLTALVGKIAIAVDNNANVTQAHHTFLRQVLEEAKKELP